MKRGRTIGQASLRLWLQRGEAEARLASWFQTLRRGNKNGRGPHAPLLHPNLAYGCRSHGENFAVLCLLFLRHRPDAWLLFMNSAMVLFTCKLLVE